eukprot:COSAG06_NODE_5560_length_3402_cov_2.273388_4_plen_111_part_00
MRGDDSKNWLKAHRSQPAAALRCSATVISPTGRPFDELGLKLCVTPVRRPSRPVRSPAREGVHTEAAVWKSVSRMPDAARASMCGVKRGRGNFGSAVAGSTPSQLAPMSP